MLGRGGTSLAVAALCASSLWFGACDLLERPRSQADNAIATTSEEWDRYVRGFVDATLAARPHFAVVQGRHEYDGLIADYSEQGLRQWGETLRDERRKAVAFDRSSLSRQQEFERSHLLAQIDRELFQLETGGAPWTSASYYLEGLDPAVYVAREYAPAAERLRAYVRFAENVPEAASQISVNLEGPLARVQLEVAAGTFETLADFVARDVAHTFSGVGDPALQTSFARANEAAHTALRGLAGGLASRAPSAPQEGFALGGDVLLEMLWKAERLTVSLGELKKAAAQELDRAFEALARTCEPLVSEGSLSDCVEQVRLPPVGWSPLASPLAATRLQVEELNRRLRLNGTVTLPAGEAVLVREALPYWNHEAARIELPGPFESGIDAVYRLGAPMISEDPGAGVFPSEADLWLLAAHEVFPGRLVQHLHSRRSPSEVSRVFVGRGSSEGWAHYAEHIAFEEGLLPATSASEVAYLLSSLLHAARAVAVLGLHTEGSSLADAEEIFRRRALLSDERARSEAVRAAVDPGRLHATIGRLLILRLREDWFFEQGEAASAAGFHDRFLAFGGAPIVAVKREMVGETGGSPL